MDPVNALPKRNPTRRLDERKVMALAADRIEELLVDLARERASNEHQSYDLGSMNLVRDLRMLSGQP